MRTISDMRKKFYSSSHSVIACQDFENKAFCMCLCGHRNFGYGRIPCTKYIPKFAVFDVLGKSRSMCFPTLTEEKKREFERHYPIFPYLDVEKFNNFKQNRFYVNHPTHAARMMNARISPGTTCEILAHHHEIMKDDPERLSTDFIKSMSGMKPKSCKEVGN